MTTDSAPLLNLIGLSREQLTDALAQIGEKPFRARQLWHWIYNRGESDFDRMTTLSKEMRRQLPDHFEIRRPVIAEDLESGDRTRKWLLRLDDGAQVESVFIPETDRGAMCLSTQVGCTLTCRFCLTGTQPLVRNLTAGEIISQFMVARDAYGEWPTSKEDRLLTNIVVMGMGEPLFNYDAIATALKIAMDPEGIAMSRRRITLSTSGVVPMMRRAGKELGVNLAISLHAATDALRSEIMPINKKYPLAELIQTCRDYPGVHNARRITFEYVMLKDVNDSEADARALIKLVKGLPCKFNLIPFNPWPGAPFECSTWASMNRFSRMLNDAGLSAPIRTTRGQDIMAACGQLRSETERASKSRKPVQITEPGLAEAV